MPTRWFILQPPRHPLARFALAVLGLVVFGALLVFGFFAFLALMAVGSVLLLVRAWRGRHGRPQATARNDDPDIIEGEYVVIEEYREHKRS